MHPHGPPWGRSLGTVILTELRVDPDALAARTGWEVKPEGACKEVLLVIDASTGQNGLVQAKQFADAVDVTGIVLTKLDGTAKGGIVLAIQSELGLPVKVVGVGEGVEDLVDFDPREFAAAIFAADDAG